MSLYSTDHLLLQGTHLVEYINNLGIEYVKISEKVIVISANFERESVQTTFGFRSCLLKQLKKQ